MHCGYLVGPPPPPPTFSVHLLKVNPSHCHAFPVSLLLCFLLCVSSSNMFPCRNEYSSAFSVHSLRVPLRFRFASYQSAMCPPYRYRGFCRVFCVFAVCSSCVSSCNFITFSPALSCVPLYSACFPRASPCVTRPFLLVVPSFVSRALPMQSG